MVCCVVEKVGIEGLDEFLIGFIVIVILSEDVVVVVKVIFGFVKDYEVLEIKLGVMEGNVIIVEEVKIVGLLFLYDGFVFMFLLVL